MDKKQMVRIVVVVVVVALIITLGYTVGPMLFDTLLAMHGLS